MIEQALLDSIHQKIHDTVKDFIIAPGSSNEILLIRSPSGVGSTYNTREASFTNDVYTIWAGPHPKQVIKDIAKVKSVPYLSSMKTNCIDFEQVVELQERGFIPQKILCEKCSNLLNCDYSRMLKSVARSAYGWCMHHNSLRNNLVEDSFLMHKRKSKVLVIDNTFLYSLTSEKQFNEYHFEEFIEFIHNTWLPNRPTQVQDILKFLVSITKCLKDSLAQDLTGSQIAKKLLKIPSHPAINIKNFSRNKDLIKDFYELITSYPNIQVKNLSQSLYPAALLRLGQGIPTATS